MAYENVDWRVNDDGALTPFIDGLEQDIAWCPQPGSQEAFLMCTVTEVCYEGTRGPGKTDALLMDFFQHVGEDDRTDEEIAAGVPKMRGWGSEWKGILFRRTYPELADVIDKSKKWFKRACPEAVFNEAKTEWRFPTGEKLLFRHFSKPSDYWSYHGHAYPWIGWEELTTWATPECYKSMFSCSRSTVAGIPRKIRSTTNPFGPGHNWVKTRFNLPLAPGRIIGDLITDSKDEYGLPEPPRVAIHGALQENRILLTADPDYVKRLVAAAPNPAARDAWILGSWDIVAGGMFDDVWHTARHHAVIPPFDIPENWWIDRSFDWGDSAPFAVQWWAESNGEDVRLANGKRMSTVRGDLFLIRQWYGWNGKPNEGVKMLAKEISAGIVERELKWGLRTQQSCRVRPGPADTGIFTEINGVSIANDMAQVVRLNGVAYPGIKWTEADKAKGSRVQGWQQIRQRLAATVPPERGVREQPGLFIFNWCKNWLRTVPVLPRDEKDMEDVDTDAEDHDGDATRYRLLNRRKTSKISSAKGVY